MDIDGFKIYPQQIISTNSSSVVLFKSTEAFTDEPCICQFIEISPNEKINVSEGGSRVEMMKRWNFIGYVDIVHYKWTPQGIWVFYKCAGSTALSISDLIKVNTIFSNVEIARIGMMILDSYSYFVKANLPNQDIELEQILVTGMRQFVMLPPVRWAYEVRILDKKTINWKPPESLEGIKIADNDYTNLHKKFVWKFGLILYSLMYKYLPFSFTEANGESATITASTAKRLLEVINYTIGSPKMVWSSTYDAINKVVAKCLIPNYLNRISYPQLYAEFSALFAYFQPSAPQPQEFSKPLTPTITTTAIEGRQKSNTMGGFGAHPRTPFDDDFSTNDTHHNAGGPSKQPTKINVPTNMNAKFESSFGQPTQFHTAKPLPKIMVPVKQTLAVPDKPLKSTNTKEQIHEIRGNITNVKNNFKTKSFLPKQKEVFKPSEDLYKIGIEDEINEAEIEEFIKNYKATLEEKKKKESAGLLNVPGSTIPSKVNSNISQTQPVSKFSSNVNSSDRKSVV